MSNFANIKKNFPITRKKSNFSKKIFFSIFPKNYKKKSFRFFLKHSNLEKAFDQLATSGYRLIHSNTFAPSQQMPKHASKDDSQFIHHSQFVFHRQPKVGTKWSIRESTKSSYFHFFVWGRQIRGANQISEVPRVLLFARNGASTCSEDT